MKKQLTEFLLNNYLTNIVTTNHGMLCELFMLELSLVPNNLINVTLFCQLKPCIFEY